MKTLRALLACPALLGISIRAQAPVPVYTAPAAAPVAPLPRSAEQLEQLVAPVALYPDALLAIMFPAAAAPTDIVLAARQLRENPEDRSQIEHRSWDESVKSLTAYPEVLRWMDENLDWTRQLGEAFASQPAEVMQSVQRLRAKARANGVLNDTPQQTIIAEAGVVRIVPAQPNVIYVPYYEPDILLLPPSSWTARPYIGFSFGVAVGSWLAFDCDWNRHTIWIGDRHRPWHGHDWRRPLVTAPVAVVSGPVRTSEARPWHPTPRVNYSPRPVAVEVIRPMPLGPNGARPGNGPAAFSPGTRAYAPAPISPETPAARGFSPGVRPLPGSTAPALPATRVAAPPAPAAARTMPAPSSDRATDAANVPSPRNRGPRPEHNDRTGTPSTTPANPPTTTPTPPAAAPVRPPRAIPPAAPANPPAHGTSRTPAPASAKPAASEPPPANANPPAAPAARNDNGRSRDRRENP